MIMKYLLLSIISILTFCISTQASFKKPGKISISRYVSDTTVSADSCRIVLTFLDYKNPQEIDSMEVTITVIPVDTAKNKMISDFILSENRMIQFVAPIGSFSISSYKPCTKNSRENYNVEILQGAVAVAIQIDMSPKSNSLLSPIRPHAVKKPVIYAYTEDDLDVTFTIKTDADLTFTYPKYDQNWKTTVLASGGFEVNNSHYPYLFWEGEMNLSQHIQQPKFGAIVAKDSVITFLESSLTQIGLNSTEKTDFITFWAPQMMDAENYYVKFLIDEAYNTSISSLESSVTPDTEIRVFMIYSPDPNFTDIQTQAFTHHTRTGFTIVEWGGSEVLPTIYSQD
ncbi:MAG: hypothetical protein ACI9N1_001606 [Flavobacteriales bacterium]|jgi:hypothetical protein